MVFSSTAFLSLFLPLFLSVYYLSPMRWRSRIILAGSYLFYGWWRLDFVLLLAAVTLFAYLVSLRIAQCVEAAAKKRWLGFGIAALLLTLGYFKYFNFGVRSFNAMMVEAGFMPFEAWAVILPIGISFYIFHAISYLVDIYRGDAPVAESVFDFAAFVALFPHLVAGPVLRYKSLAEQFAHRSHRWEIFNEGAVRFALGFCKKVLIADSIAPVADLTFTQTPPGLLEAWLGVLAYTAQLYFDFSGYSDMAIGLALMLGFRFPENFRQPYRSRSITEFWQRWHISLSQWLRDYLYIPLGGNRKGAARTYLNLFLTMLLGGLWHGANWTFVLWGAWHGLWLAAERYLRQRRSGVSEPVYPRLLALPLSLLVVMLGWVLFRAPDISTAWQVYAGMLGRHGLGWGDDITWRLDPFELAMVAVAWLLILAGPRLLPQREVEPSVWAAQLPATQQLLLCLLFVVAVSKMIAQSFSPFLYFQF